MKIENNHYNISFPQIIIAAGGSRTRTPSPPHPQSYGGELEDEEEDNGADHLQEKIEQRLSFKEEMENDGNEKVQQISERYSEHSNFEEDQEETPQIELVHQTLEQQVHKQPSIIQMALSPSKQQQ